MMMRLLFIRLKGKVYEQKEIQNSLTTF